MAMPSGQATVREALLRAEVMPISARYAAVIK
jgi:hypothetical protein